MDYRSRRTCHTTTSSGNGPSWCALATTSALHKQQVMAVDNGGGKCACACAPLPAPLPAPALVPAPMPSCAPLPLSVAAVPSNCNITKSHMICMALTCGGICACTGQGRPCASSSELPGSQPASCAPVWPCHLGRTPWGWEQQEQIVVCKRCAPILSLVDSPSSASRVNACETGEAVTLTDVRGV